MIRMPAILSVLLPVVTASAQAAADNAVPLDAARWVAVGAGARLAAVDAGLEVRYARTSRAAFGLALPLPEGLPAGCEALRLELSAPAGATVLVSLRRDDGGVHSWPMRGGRAGAALELSLPLAQLRWDRFQNGERDEVPFASARVRALSITDIGGFLGGDGGDEQRLTVRSLQIVGAASSDPKPAAGAHVGPGEAALFEALVRGRGDADGAIRALRLEVLERPESARSALLLGLAFLWRAAEGDPADPRGLDDALLADAWFSRVAELDPEEDRLPSWQVPTRLTLAGLLGRSDRAGALLAGLREAAERDPGFHGFALALVAWTQAPDSPGFRDGLAAIRRALAASAADDASVANRPWWPHNREGFLLFAADYEHRAGNRARADALLERAEREPGFERWPLRHLVRERRAAWAAGEAGAPADRPWLAGQGCVVCHRAGPR